MTGYSIVQLWSVPNTTYSSGSTWLARYLAKDEGREGHLSDWVN